MKRINTILVVLLFTVISVNAQEKRINFSSGTLKIYSSKNFIIKGYDGDEVVIKSLHGNKSSSFFTDRKNIGFSAKNSPSRSYINGTVTGNKNYSFPLNNDSIKSGRVFFFNDEKRKKGLQRLGKNQENLENGIYFTIEQNNEELIFKDISEKDQFRMFTNESYEIMIPNAIKLNWHTDLFEDEEIGQRTMRFFNSKASAISNFSGEVEISSTLNNMKLEDVTGPVSINSMGGNITISFDKKTPKKLYSIYSNDGFIDVKLPSDSDVLVDVEGEAIYSDIDFKVLNEKDEPGKQKMRLKLKTGKVKMKLNAGLGSIYLRNN